jgi:transcriptional regulator with XRE-family HTH domain
MPTIRELRQARDWTQFDLAVSVGVQPRVALLRKLGQLFEISSDEIILET